MIFCQDHTDGFAGRRVKEGNSVAPTPTAVATEGHVPVKIEHLHACSLSPLPHVLVLFFFLYLSEKIWQLHFYLWEKLRKLVYQIKVSSTPSKS